MFQETTLLKSVELLLLQDAINVCWVDRVLRDGETIAETPRRQCYGRSQKADFSAAVPSSALYVSAMGW